jgi:hypothetical protein
VSISEQAADISTLDRLADWQQGDFTLMCPDLLYLDLPEAAGEPHDPVFDETNFGCVIISQTCDIVREIDVIPNVTVCPLVKINPARRADIEKGQAPKFGLVDNLPDDVVVDFTRAMSVTKKLLVTWERLRGCETEDRIVEFSGSLERFFGRFAFPDAFNESIRSLRSAIYSKHEKDSDLGKSLRSIREIRVFPHANWNDQKSVPITFFLILLDDDEREVESWDAIREAVSAKFSEISWIDPFHPEELILHITTLSDMTAGEYLSSYPLDLNALSYSRKYQRD